MSTRYRISHLACDDLDGIWDYIAADNPQAATKLLAKIEARFQMLCRQPMIGETRDEVLTGLRSFPIGNYVVFYRLAHAKDVSIEIVRVLHGARDIRRLF